MLFEQVRSGGCLSYLIGCEETRTASSIDPELDESDRYVTLATERGLRISYVVDTHTHADHFSATASWRGSTRCRWSCIGAARRRSSTCGSRTARR